jgi:hypothetical protein
MTAPLQDGKTIWRQASVPTSKHAGEQARLHAIRFACLRAGHIAGKQAARLLCQQAGLQACGLAVSEVSRPASLLACHNASVLARHLAYMKACWQGGQHTGKSADFLAG